MAPRLRNKKFKTFCFTRSTSPIKYLFRDLSYRKDFSLSKLEFHHLAGFELLQILACLIMIIFIFRVNNFFLVSSGLIFYWLRTVLIVSF